MRAVATALGETARGEELIRTADAAFSDAVAAHPEFRGKVGATVLPFDGKYGAFTAADARGQFMTGLGFVQPPAIAERDDRKSFYVEVSSEQSGLLDGDVLVMLADEGAAKQQVDSDPVLRQSRSSPAATWSCRRRHPGRDDLQQRALGPVRPGAARPQLAEKLRD